MPATSSSPGAALKRSFTGWQGGQAQRPISFSPLFSNFSANDPNKHFVGADKMFVGIVTRLLEGSYSFFYGVSNMKQNQTRDFLIRKIPLEIFNLLEESAREHNRSITQEAIVVLAAGLSIHSKRIRQPKSFKWQKKISNQFVIRAVDEGRA